MSREKLTQEEKLQRELRRYEAMRVAQRKLDWQEVLGLSSGAGLRLFVYLLYEKCGLHAAIQEQSSAIYRLEGRRDIAVEILKEIEFTAPEMLGRVLHAYPNLLADHPLMVAALRKSNEPEETDDGGSDDDTTGNG